MGINLILARAKNNVIGLNNTIPWKNKEDIKMFARITKNNAVLMGRKTWDSLPDQYKPLKDRFNFVLTKDQSLLNINLFQECQEDPIIIESRYDREPSYEIKMKEKYKNTKFSSDIKDFIETNYYGFVGKFVIGGKQIYNLFLKDYNKLIDKIYLSEIDEEPEGDAFFENDWLNNFYLLKQDTHETFTLKIFQNENFDKNNN